LTRPLAGKLGRVSHGVQGQAKRTAVTGSVAKRVAQLMQALATPSRVHILGCLRDGPQSVTEIIEAVGMAQSAVSHQLRVLREMRFVVGEKRGRQVLYRLHDEHVASLLDEAVFHMQHLDLGVVERHRAAS
jgi:ArsR family transcriptional regulator, nickel/cobalt-responsive transcriptional repressor